MCELPPELIQRASLVVVDQLEAAMAEAGELIQAVEAGFLSWQSVIELGQLLQAPPTSIFGISIFKSVGVAIQDWAIAALLHARVEDQVPAGIELWP